MGCAFLLLGFGVGFMMYLQPEGLNPEWGLWAAELVPVIFALAGIYIIADAFGYPRVAVRMVQGLLVGMLSLLHWIAFFVTDGQCSASFAFLGTVLAGRQFDAWVCRFVLLLFVGVVDAVIVMPAAIQAWRKWRIGGEGSAGK
ncbi:MAG: hypothetical protein ABI537_16070 [Casimicrobiaceae bacterium]